MPKLSPDIFYKPEPVTYGVQTKSAGTVNVRTNDAVTRLLAEKYGASPQAADNLANDIRSGDAPDEGLQGEAMTKLAEQEQRRLRAMKLYVAAKTTPDSVNEEARNWAAQVDAKHKEMVRQRAEATVKPQSRPQTRAVPLERVAQTEQQRLGNMGDLAKFPGSTLADNGMALDMPARPLNAEAETARKLLSMGMDPTMATAFALRLHGHEE